VSQVVHLDEVEVVLTQYQIGLPIGPFNPLLISLSTVISDGSMVDFFSTLIRLQFPYLPIQVICLGASSLGGTELVKNVLCLEKCLQVAFHVGKCVWCMTPIFSHEREINQRANTLQIALEIMILITVRISQCGCQYGRNTMAEIAHLLPTIV